MGARSMIGERADGLRTRLRWDRALLSACVALAAYALLVPDQFADPFMRNDDFLVHFPLPALAWENTLTEGRWGNQLWAWRGVPGQRHVLFALTAALWALAAGVIAARLFAEDSGPGRTVLFGLALALAPQTSMQLFWYNFSAPAALVLLAGAVMLARARHGAMLGTLALLVPAALMTYPTNAFALLAMALAFGTGTDMARAVRLGVVLVASLAVGIVAIYTLNWAVHGHFGLLLADWRGARPASDLGTLLANGLRLVPEGVTRALRWPVLAALLALPMLAAVLALQSHRPVWLRAMLAGAALSLTLAIALSAMAGALLPNRATGFLWTFAVLSLALGAREARAPVARSCLAGAVVAVLTGAIAWHGARDDAIDRYQAWTQRLGAAALAHSGPPRVLLVTGALAERPEAAVLHEAIGFEFRLEDLTGLEVRYCPALTGPPVDPERFHPAARPRIAHGNAGTALCRAHAEALDRLGPGFGPLAPEVLGLRL